MADAAQLLVDQLVTFRDQVRRLERQIRTDLRDTPNSAVEDKRFTEAMRSLAAEIGGYATSIDGAVGTFRARLPSPEA